MKTFDTQQHLFAVYDTQTGQFVKFGSKIAWVSTGAAKNAFNLHNGKCGYNGDGKGFNEQNRYIVVQVDSDRGYFKC